MKDSKENASQNKTKLVFVVSSLVVLIAASAVYFWFRQKSNSFFEEAILTKYDKFFPYVFDQQFQMEVNEYMNNTDFKNLLLVYGSRGLGKTRGLRKLCKNYSNNGYLVLDFDFLRVNELDTVNDILGYLRKTIINGFVMLDAKEKNTLLPTELISLLNEYTIAANAKKFLKKEKQILNNKNLNDIMNKLLALLNKIEENPQFTFEIMFKILNTISKFVKPILVFHNIEKLYDCNDVKIGEYLDVFWKDAFELVFSSLKFPMIFEVSDLSAIIDGKIDMRHNLFKIIEIKPFQYNDAKKILVDEEAVFTNENFQSLWDEFGGNGECMYLGYQYLSEGYSISNAISAIKSYMKESISLPLINIKNETVHKRRYKYLKKLSKGPVPLAKDIESAKFFVRNKIATIKNLTCNSRICLNENFKNIFTTKAETTTQNV